MDRRTVGVACLLVSLVACGFDTSGLRPPRGPDAGGDLVLTEAGADLLDGPRAERPPDGLPPGEARVDLSGDLKADLPKPSCTGNPSLCVGQTPICDGVCRGCRDHSECTPGGLCRADGSCPAASQISFVDDSCTSTRDGTKGHPYCKINDAVGKAPPYILVRAGTYSEDTILNTSKEVYAEPGAVLKPSACDKLVFDGKITALLAGFEIQGAVLYKAGARATLLQNRIGPSPCIGVSTDNPGNEVILDRNLIFDHAKGGVRLDGKYTVRNNIIIRNGKVDRDWGGIKIVATDPSSLFINNTVASNFSKGSNKEEAGGVRCEAKAAKATFVNTILWGNTFNNTGALLTDRQYGPGCLALYSLEQLKPDATPASGSKNVAGDPLFSGTGPVTDAPYYRLTSGSPAKDKGTGAAAPSIDYDGEPRDSAPDIGADEIFP
jgi:hypothetical protein